MPQQTEAPGEAALDLIGMTEQEWREHNAVAWLQLTARELVEQSGSLGLEPHLVPFPIPASRTVKYELEGGGGVPVPMGDDARQATWEEVDVLRAAADEQAVLHAGKKFVDNWVKENRADTDERHLVGGVV